DQIWLDPRVRGPAARGGDARRARRGGPDSNPDGAEERLAQAVPEDVLDGRRGAGGAQRSAVCSCAQGFGPQDRGAWTALDPRRGAARYHVRSAFDEQRAQSRDRRGYDYRRREAAIDLFRPAEGGWFRLIVELAAARRCALSTSAQVWPFSDGPRLDKLVRLPHLLSVASASLSHFQVTTHDRT